MFPVNLKQILTQPLYAASSLVLGVSAFAMGWGVGNSDLVQAQTSTLNNNQPGSIGNNSDGNVIAPIGNQNANQNQSNPNNIINVPNVYPLQTPLVAPVNTENDFGLNFSLGMNTLDARNMTAFIGVIYQPGRTNSHVARMTRLSKETEILEQQKKLLEAQVSLLQQQAEEAKLRVEQLRQVQSSSGGTGGVKPRPALPSSNQPNNVPPNMVRPNVAPKSLWNSFTPINDEQSEVSMEQLSTSNFNATGSMGGLLPTVQDGR
ncbi:MAG: hypothetical protein WCO45_18380 [Pseudanabaena sp. ELA607]|jgi:hypothetical protein